MPLFSLQYSTSQHTLEKNLTQSNYGSNGGTGK